jgi:hypothetical protein
MKSSRSIHKDPLIPSKGSTEGYFSERGIGCVRNKAVKSCSFKEIKLTLERGPGGPDDRYA